VTCDMQSHSVFSSLRGVAEVLDSEWKT
jgi:hypothetical protein